ncbi:uncharacterized protein ATNIH1004_005158 [Aspergillus tanneri]|uniref:Uncharacterized protein n=1 Tax=Aspergillus tanneri TaxID=1220188 RepID=A0A5M9MQ68_9EURO|nr:uncharacterized protein ATNIH1004_005158 [Aspergillus tanneri]KAA8649261.1 hypothetical protein ATNIH1004_005158 [Aspergillus tanneri]
MQNSQESEPMENKKREIVGHFMNSLKLSPSTEVEEERLWHIEQDDEATHLPDSFEPLMADYTQALNAETHKERLIQPRLDSILLLLLAAVKKMDQISEHEISAGESTLSWDEAIQISGAPYWGFQETFTIPHIVGWKSHTLETIVNYVLWYGTRRNLETNLVVVRCDTIMDSESWRALAAMSIVHRTRKDAGKNGEIYGICTDSYMWTFLHFSDHSQVSKLVLRWSDGQQKIISQICKIIKQATIHNAERLKYPAQEDAILDKTGDAEAIQHEKEEQSDDD